MVSSSIAGIHPECNNTHGGEEGTGGDGEDGGGETGGKLGGETGGDTGGETGGGGGETGGEPGGGGGKLGGEIIGPIVFNTSSMSASSLAIFEF